TNDPSNIKLLLFLSFTFASVHLQSLTEGAGSYYHLTHSELVALLVQREAELERDLEDYIDTLLVRIMEQKPTLLQVRSKFK
uniref:FIP-RBD domain-containing protein n=1 Tax=Stegastes partitus TaxID=144197 RepID=A0A3B5AGG2_9TELE